MSENKRIEVEGTPNRTISHEEFAKAIGGEVIGPVNGDGAVMFAGMEVWVWDDDAQTAVSHKIGKVGPKMSEYADPKPDYYKGVRNKSAYSTKETAIAGHKTMMDDFEKRYPSK